jgi:two-component system alkaline phosphatase synthesis response regulator PhoP
MTVKGCPLLKKKALVVDDEKPIVTLVTYNLEKAGFLTDTAYEGKTAIEKAAQNDYDMIILDIMLPEISGLGVLKTLRGKGLETPIIMLTAKDEEADKIRGLELGADDYLTKPFSPKEMIARIHAVLRRVEKPSRSKVNIGNLVINADHYDVQQEGKEITFTRKEFELLYHLASNLNEVMSRDRLLKEVWNYDFAGDTRIVDVHISRLREKIEPDTRKPLYIKTVRGRGYKMEEPAL